MFPYIRQIRVNDCYTYQDFNILDKQSDKFNHIILTGKNGSGKSTILNRIGFLMQQAENHTNPVRQVNFLKRVIAQDPKHKQVLNWKNNLKELTDVELILFDEDNQQGSSDTDRGYQYFLNNRGKYIFSFFKAHRRVNLEDVFTVTKETDFVNQLTNLQDSESFIRQFKQYLVNKKVYEAFDFMNSKTDSSSQNKVFFDKLTDTLRAVFKDEELTLDFVQENFEFFLNLGDGRKVTFNQLSEGFSAFLSILMDLLVRTDLIRKQLEDYSFDPPGIVLIDEPETHFHLEMQYEILPLLVSLFPRIQLIIATHSPAIISSLEDAEVFDLSSKSNVSNWIEGSSYSELMIKHFGLENEFSPKADRLLNELNTAYSHKDISRIRDLLVEYDKILTPSLRLEIESRIIELTSKESND